MWELSSLQRECQLLDRNIYKSIVPIIEYRLSTFTTKKEVHMKVLKAHVDWREGSGAAPLLNILVDRRPLCDMKYEKRGDIYFAEKDGYASFYAWSGIDNNGGMYGDEVPITMKDGRQVILKGPWSSNPESVEEAGFKPTIPVAIADDPEVFERAGGNYAGNITLDLAQCIADGLPGVGIGYDRFGQRVLAKKE